MAHLTSQLVEQARRGTAAIGRYRDRTTPGLLLIVKGNGASWILRYQLGGRRRDMGLGPVKLLGLARARELANARRVEIRIEKRDPLEGRSSLSKRLSFDAAARAYIESQAPGWRDPRAPQTWTSTLKTYASPVIGSLGVDTINVQHVLAIQQPIWPTKPETASREAARRSVPCVRLRVAPRRNPRRKGIATRRFRRRAGAAAPAPSGARLRGAARVAAWADPTISPPPPRSSRCASCPASAGTHAPDQSIRRREADAARRQHEIGGSLRRAAQRRATAAAPRAALKRRRVRRHGEPAPGGQGSGWPAAQASPRGTARASCRLAKARDRRRRDRIQLGALPGAVVGARGPITATTCSKTPAAARRAEHLRHG